MQADYFRQANSSMPIEKNMRNISDNLAEIKNNPQFSIYDGGRKNVTMNFKAHSLELNVALWLIYLGVGEL